MANSSKHVVGIGDLSAVLKGIPAAMRAEILGTAVGTAAKPVVRSAKRNAQKSKRTGALQSSIASVVKKYPRNGSAVAVVGPSKDYFRGGKRVKRGGDRRGADKPHKYAHLVEFGHYSNAGTGRTVSSAKGKTRRSGTLNPVSFVLGQPFLRPALLSSKSEVASALQTGVSTGIDRVRARLVKAGVHKT